MVKACLQSVYPYGREKETDSLPPPTVTYPTSKLSGLPSQERREENREAGVSFNLCAQTVRKTIAKEGVNAVKIEK